MGWTLIKTTGLLQREEGSSAAQNLNQLQTNSLLPGSGAQKSLHTRLRMPRKKSIND